MVTLFGKLALLGALALGTYFSDSFFAAADGACPFRDDYNCCVYSCQHDPGTGCNGSSTCCANLCR